MTLPSTNGSFRPVSRTLSKTAEHSCAYHLDKLEPDCFMSQNDAAQRTSSTEPFTRPDLPSCVREQLECSMSA